MSATMRVEDFTNNTALFKTKPAFIEIPVRQYPVHIHFNKVTPENYLDAARRKIAKIHSSLPDGGILVFVTGQEEVKRLVKLLNRMFSASATDGVSKTKKVRKFDKSAPECPAVGEVSEFDLTEIPAFPSRKLGDGNDNSDDDDLPDVEEVKSSEPLLVIPLYSMLSIKEQEKVINSCNSCFSVLNVLKISAKTIFIRYLLHRRLVRVCASWPLMSQKRL